MRIADILGYLDDVGYKYVFVGNKDIEIKGFSSLNNYKSGTITWVKKKEAYNQALGCGITCAVIQNGIDVMTTNCIIVDNSKEVFFGILKQFWGQKKPIDQIGNGTIISDNVKMAEGVVVGCNCSIMGDVSIGKNTVIENNVVIQGKVIIGDNCLIHSGVVIGADGFGFFFDENDNIGKVEHFGGVIIKSKVEIGANSCIDRGTIDDTVIGDNSKIDNLVHIAHNVIIGENVCVVAGAIVCGSVNIKDGAYVAPGAIIKNQLVVGQNSFIGLGAVATNEVDEKMVVAGVPAKNIREVRKGDK